VWALATVMALAASALAASALVLLLGPEHQGSLHLNHKSSMGQCCIVHQVLRSRRKNSNPPIYWNSRYLARSHLED